MYGPYEPKDPKYREKINLKPGEKLIGIVIDLVDPVNNTPWKYPVFWKGTPQADGLPHPSSVAAEGVRKLGALLSFDPKAFDSDVVAEKAFWWQDVPMEHGEGIGTKEHRFPVAPWTPMSQPPAPQGGEAAPTVAAGAPSPGTNGSEDAVTSVLDALRDARAAGKGGTRNDIVNRLIVARKGGLTKKEILDPAIGTLTEAGVIKAEGDHFVIVE